MNILILNLGSTSFKYALFDAENLELTKKGNFAIPDVKHDMYQIQVDELFRKTLREVGDINQINVVGHRVVHGGDKYLATQKIETKDIYELEDLNDLAPLHNPYNLAGIKSVHKYLPEVANYVVFDTGFFENLPLSAKIYPIPYKYYEQGIHRFGFHGISHKFAAQTACQKLKIDFNTAKLITIHLGGGCSVAAIQAGQPLDTSMGFTPLEGLMMQTRGGDLDPGVILSLISEFNGNVEKVKNILNYESGIKGISGCQNYLDLLAAVKNKEPKAILAWEMFINRLKKYVGAYLMLLDGADAIVFTGEIGAGNPLTRKKICDKMTILSNIPVAVVEPNEELAMAKEILLCLP